MSLSSLDCDRTAKASPRWRHFDAAAIAAGPIDLVALGKGPSVRIRAHGAGNLIGIGNSPIVDAQLETIPLLAGETVEVQMTKIDTTTTCDAVTVFW